MSNNRIRFSFKDLTSNLKLVDTIEIGYQSNKTNSGAHSISIGSQTGIINQSTFGIAIGTNAGQNNQGSNSIAIGTNAGQSNQGSNSIAIGTNAGQNNQSANSIILNSSGNTLNANTSGLFVNPIRNRSDSDNILLYKPDTYEIVRQPFPILIGDLKYALSNVDHNGWLLCDGRLLNVNDHPQLFSLIGYSFGGSGGSFNLPDPRSRTLGFVGQGTGLSNRTLGQNVGSETHTLIVNELPSHSHTINDPGHLHSYERPKDVLELVEVDLDVAAIAATSVYPILTTGSSTTGISIDSSGLGQPYNLFQPTLFIGNIFIYSD